MRFLIPAVVALSLFGQPALAATVDIGPILTPVLGIVGTALLVILGLVLTWVFRWLKAKTGLDLALLEGQIREAVNGMAYRAIDAAIVATQKKIGDGGVIKIDNAFVAMAAQYLVTAAPGYLRQLGVTKADGSIDMDRVRAMIESRLPTSNAAPASVAEVK